MKASKENKVYTISNLEKDTYLTKGYTIYEDDGTVLEYPSSKTVTLKEHNDAIDNLKEGYNLHIEKLEKEKEELFSEITKLKKTKKGEGTAE